MITKPSAWEKKAMNWVQWVLEAQVPTLGICYGHQMIAQILGGTVGTLPDGPEIGYERLHFTGEYESDPIFGLYPSHFDTFAFHYQTVTRLPYRAKVFGRSHREPSHAVKYDENIWGVQYHPEFNQEVAQQYLIHESLELERAGYNLRKLIQHAEIDRPPDPLIPRFVELC
jgi:GMP synthase (glutamine-hydrolysing)